MSFICCLYIHCILRTQCFYTNLASRWTKYGIILYNLVFWWWLLKAYLLLQITFTELLKVAMHLLKILRTFQSRLFKPEKNKFNDVQLCIKPFYLNTWLTIFLKCTPFCVNIANSWKTLFYTYISMFICMLIKKYFYLRQQIHVYIMNHYFEW